MTRAGLRWWLVAVLLLATALRFYRLDAQSFWNDEGNSARLSERRLDLIIAGTASDVHPPLYYLSLHGWRALVGSSEFALRGLSALSGVVTVALSGALARALWRRRPVLVLLSAVLVAVNPALVYYSQEARMYALLALCGTAATWLLVTWHRRRRWPWAVAYGAVLTAGLYTHYAFPAVMVAHSLAFAAWWWGRKRPRSPLSAWIAVNTGALLAYAPWLPVFLRQSGTRPGAGRAPQFFMEVGEFLVQGATAPPRSGLLPLLSTTLLLLAALAAMRRRRYAALLLALSVAAPLLLMWVTGATLPSYFKFAVLAVPPLVLLAARGTVGVWSWSRPRSLRRFPGQAAALLLLGSLLGGTFRSLDNLYHDPAYARADYRGIAARIAADNHPNAGVILDAPNQWEVFTYYHDVDGATPVYPLPRGAPDPAALDAELDAIAAAHDRLYAIFWGEAERDPQRLVERWLDARAFKAVDEWVGDVRFVMYAVPPAAAAEMATPLDAAFGEAIILRGYSLGSDRLPAGDVVTATLFWESATPLETRYKVFLHLVDAQGALVAQRDSEPGGGLALTTTWTPGVTVRDNHGVLVPPSAPPGVYTLRLGLYDIADPTRRLLLANGADFLELAHIDVVDPALERGVGE